MIFEGDFVGGVITGETKAKVGTDADFFDFPSIDGSPPAVLGGGDIAVLLDDTPGGRGADQVPGDARGGRDLGGRGRLHLAEQEGRRLRLPRRRDPTRRAGADRRRRQRALRHVRPAARRRSARRPARASGGSSSTSSRTPSDVDGTAQAAGERRGEGPTGNGRADRWRPGGRHATERGSARSAVPVPPARAGAARRARRLSDLLLGRPELLSTPTAGTSSASTTTRTMFTSDATRTAIKNNLHLGGVRTEHRHRARPDLRGAHRAGRWGTAFKVIDLHAHGDLVPVGRRHLAPDLRAGPAARPGERHRVGAVVGIVVRPPGVLPGAHGPPRTSRTSNRTADGAVASSAGSVAPGDTAAARPGGDPADAGPAGGDAVQAVDGRGAPTGQSPATVWLDFTPGGGGEAGVHRPHREGTAGRATSRRSGRRGRRARPPTATDGTFASRTGIDGDVPTPAARVELPRALRRGQLAGPDPGDPVDHRVRTSGSGPGSRWW